MNNRLALIIVCILGSLTIAVNLLGMLGEEKQEMNFGTKIKDVDDIEWLRECVIELYNICDDISTYGDMCKSDDASFRKVTEKRITDMSKRIDCDGYELYRREPDKGNCIEPPTPAVKDKHRESAYVPGWPYYRED